MYFSYVPFIYLIYYIGSFIDFFHKYLLLGLQMAEIRAVMGNASPILGGQRPQMMQRPLLTEPVLSPILTDTEISPLHRTGIGAAPGNGKSFVSNFQSKKKKIKEIFDLELALQESNPQILRFSDFQIFRS